MLPHELEPEAEQGLDRAQQRMQGIGGAALMMPGERHGDNPLERLAKNLAPPRMGKAVRAARHQNERDNVEGADSGPHGERRKNRAMGGDSVNHAAEHD